MKRILYLQYTNPAGYPPLQHSSRILADAGWQVLFLGTGSLGTDKLRFPPHVRISVRQLRFQAAGWRQKLHYLYFLLWCFVWAARWRPTWVYASDPSACPPALLLATVLGRRLIYHEHDLPSKEHQSLFVRFCLRARRRCARKARLCILPNADRARKFSEETQPARPVEVVWNCPSRGEVIPGPRTCTSVGLRLLYHGSIVPERLPLSLVEALALLPLDVTLDLTGYETVGTRGYISELQNLAALKNISNRLRVHGAVPRSNLLLQCPTFDAGVALIPRASGDENFQAMTGASNKPFDYLACGLAILVSDLPDWQEMFVSPGYAVACDPADPSSIAAAILRLYENPCETHAMGERGRQRILAEWNYEAQLAQVLDHLNHRP